MKYLLSFLFCISVAQAKTLKIAIIDSGIYPEYVKTLPLCPDGHKSFVDGPWNQDSGAGHGTNVASLITMFAGKNLNYCLVIYKVFNIHKNDGLGSFPSIQAVQAAIKEDVAIINYSGGGEDFSSAEMHIWKEALNKGIVVIVAAGNMKQNLDENCNYYPACYQVLNKVRFFGVVGSLDSNGKRAASSNYGKIVTLWEKGMHIEGGGIIKSGTSQATATVTGKLIRKYFIKVLPKRKDGDYEN